MLSAENMGYTGQKEGELVRKVTTAQAFPDPNDHEHLDHLLSERAAADNPRAVGLIDADIAEILAKGNQYLDRFVEELPDYLPDSGIINIEKSTKTPQSLGEKWTRKGLLVTPDNKIYNVHDTHRARIITLDEDVLYDAAGRLCENYRLVPGSLDDYVANPKPNGYQAWQGTFLVPRKGEERAAVEIQLRTLEMHRRAEQDGYTFHKPE